MNAALVFLVAELTLIGPLSGPAAPFALRTCFPGAFRRAALHLGEPSWWEADFGQTLSTDPEAVRRYQKPPLPFVFDLPVVRAGQDGAVTVGLTLAGSAINHLPAYLAALRILFSHEEFRQQFPARLDSIAAVDSAGGRHEVWRDGNEPLLASVPLVAAAQLVDRLPASPEFLQLQILTPLRIMHDRRPCREPDAALLVRALMRRVSAMLYYYEREELSVDYRWLAERSSSVKTVRSSLRWQEWGGGVQGVVGSVAVAGELADFMTFLALGERLHAGKGASYGMGQYRISADGAASPL